MRLGIVLLAAIPVMLSSVLPAHAGKMKKSLIGVKKYVVLNFLLAVSDYESAHAVQHRGACHEGNSAFRKYPIRGRFYAEGLAIDAGPELAGWFLHHKRSRFWQLPFALVTAWHAEGIVTNFRCDGSSGRDLAA